MSLMLGFLSSFESKCKSSAYMQPMQCFMTTEQSSGLAITFTSQWQTYRSNVEFNTVIEFDGFPVA
jgi:hypothetical protein